MLASNVNEYIMTRTKLIVSLSVMEDDDWFSQTFPNITTPRARELCQNMFVIVIPLDEQLLAIYQQRHYNTNPLSSVINDDVNGKYNAFCLRVRSHFSPCSLSLTLSVVNKSSGLISAQSWRVEQERTLTWVKRIVRRTSFMNWNTQKKLMKKRPFQNTPKLDMIIIRLSNQNAFKGLTLQSRTSIEDIKKKDAKAIITTGIRTSGPNKSESN